MEEGELVVLLSGEHPTLPMLELRGIVEAERVGEEPRLLSPQVAQFSALDPLKAAMTVSRMASFARSVSAYLGSARGSLRFVNELLDRIDWSGLRGPFAVRAIRVQGALRQLSREEISERVAESILRANSFLKVDLEAPKTVVLVILSGNLIHLGILLAEVDRSAFRERDVSRRPFKHPASMNPRLARAMVNLARVRRGDVVLDPFVGAGGIALEVLSVGGRLLGCDVDQRMVAGTELNLRHYGYAEGYHLWVCDATSLRLARQVDAVVTDPPYGRSTPLTDHPLRTFSAFVSRVTDFLRLGGRLVAAYPAEAHPDEVIASYLEVEEVVDYREHKSLTRRIVVARSR